MDSVWTEALGRIETRFSPETGKPYDAAILNRTPDHKPVLPDWPVVQSAHPGEREHVARHTLARLHNFWKRIGPRHRACTLENFEATTEAQRRAVEQLRQYRSGLVENIRGGVNIVISGPTGTGKDHLLSSLFNVTMQNGIGIQWTSGPMLYAAIRGTMDRRDTSEGEELERYTRPSVLVISDPVVAAGVLTPFQSDCLFQILDERWRQKRATWVTLNVANRAEADTKLGTAIVDRLIDGALTIMCAWPSYRKAAQ